MIQSLQANIRVLHSFLSSLITLGDCFDIVFAFEQNYEVIQLIEKQVQIVLQTSAVSIKDALNEDEDVLLLRFASKVKTLFIKNQAYIRAYFKKPFLEFTLALDNCLESKSLALALQRFLAQCKSVVEQTCHQINTTTVNRLSRLELKANPSLAKTRPRRRTKKADGTYTQPFLSNLSPTIKVEQQQFSIDKSAVKISKVFQTQRITVKNPKGIEQPVDKTKAYQVQQRNMESRPSAGKKSLKQKYYVSQFSSRRFKVGGKQHEPRTDHLGEQRSILAPTRLVSFARVDSYRIHQRVDLIPLCLAIRKSGVL